MSGTHPLATLKLWAAKKWSDHVAEHQIRLAQHPYKVDCIRLSREIMDDEFDGELFERRAWCFETLNSSHMVKQVEERQTKGSYIRFLFENETEAILFKLRFC